MSPQTVPWGGAIWNNFGEGVGRINLTLYGVLFIGKYDERVIRGFR